MLTFEQENRAYRFDALEGLLRKALDTLAATKGRAAVDDRGVGATRFLVEKSLESLSTIRNDVLSTFPKTCSCGDSYDEYTWQELELVGHQDDGDGGQLELRNCGGCSSTIAIPLSTNTEVPR